MNALTEIAALVAASNKRMRQAGAIPTRAALAALAVATPALADNGDKGGAAPAPKQYAAIEDVVVTAKSRVKAAEEKLNTIPGGTSVVSGAVVARGRETTNADLLRLQPGVIAASTGGEDSIKVSIRGSGVNNGVGYFRQGIKYTFDDLPITTPSGTPYELFEPQGLQYTEILRGDDAFLTGPLALGGTINYVTDNGHTAPYSEIRTEAGSFGYFKGSLATGNTIGNWDYYVLLTGVRQDGWQQQSNSNAQHVAANLGWQPTPDIETRFYFRYGREEFQGPGNVTRAQIESDTPNQANPGNVATNYVRDQPGSELVGNVTKIMLDDTQTIETGAAFQNFPIVIGVNSPTLPILAEWEYGNVAAQAKYTNTAPLFGHNNEFTAAGYWSDDIYGTAVEIAGASSHTKPFGPEFGYVNFFVPNVVNGQTIYQNKFNGSMDSIGLVNDNFELVHNLWLTVGAGFVATPRHLSTVGITASDALGNGPQVVQSVRYDRTNYGFVPRVGLRYDVVPNLTLFTSYGGNIEPREDWAGTYGPYNGKSAFTYPNYGILDLRNQDTKTVEVGFRGHYSIFTGSVDFYHAWVKDELLTILNPVTNINSTINAPQSTHQGVEAALDTTIWEGAASLWPTASGKDARVHLTQTYTWSDLHFNGDATFPHNQEPGLPPHFYQGELDYDDPTGVYAYVDARVSSSTFVDYLNTFRTAPYAVFGLTIGWRQQTDARQRWQASFSVDNLTDRKYAIAVQPTFNAGGKDAAVENPGQGRGFFAALSYKF
jgi:iron complex outermembrane recepter protein